VIVLPDGCGLTNNEAACNQGGNDFFIPVRMLLNFGFSTKIRYRNMRSTAFRSFDSEIALLFGIRQFTLIEPDVSALLW
jgi:hypothetical protein